MIPTDPKYPISPKRLKKLIAAFEKEHTENRVLDVEAIVKEEERKKSADPIAYEKEQKKLIKEMPKIIADTWNSVEVAGFLKFFISNDPDVDEKFYKMTMVKVKKLWPKVFRGMKKLSKAKNPNGTMISDEDIFNIIVIYFASFIKHKSGRYFWGRIVPIDKIAPYVYRKLIEAINEEWKKGYIMKVDSRGDMDDFIVDDDTYSNNTLIAQDQFIKLWNGSEDFFLIEHISTLTGVKATTLRSWDTKGWIYFKRMKDYESEELDGKWLKHLDKRVVASSELNEFIKLVKSYRDEKFDGYLNAIQATKKYNLGSGGSKKLIRFVEKGRLTFKKIKGKNYYPVEELDRLFP